MARAAFVVALMASAVSGQVVTIEYLGTGGPNSDISATGEVVYQSWRQDGWVLQRTRDGSNGTTIDPGEWDDIGRVRINASGQVAYVAQNFRSPSVTLRYTDGEGVIDINTIGAAQVQMTDMNDHGDLVGQMQSADWSRSGAFLYTDAGGMREVLFSEHPTSTAGAVAINNAGQIAGVYEDREGSHTVRYSELSGSVSIGSLGGRHTVGTAMNEHGDIVGWADMPGGGTHAFLYTDPGGLQDLDSGDGQSRQPVDINDRKWIIAYASHGPQLWTPESGWLTFDSLLPDTVDAEFFDIAGINNAGEILGTGRFGDSWGMLRMTIHSIPATPTLFVFGPLLGWTAVGRRR